MLAAPGDDAFGEGGTDPRQRLERGAIGAVEGNTAVGSGCAGLRRGLLADGRDPDLLAVDDEPNIALSLEYLMKGQGFEVRVARDGEAALEALRPKLVANGGRVLNVTATGRTVTDAQKRAYAGVDAIDWPGGFCRRDIGWRAIEREHAAG